jgi:hypothetical protein
MTNIEEDYTPILSEVYKPPTMKRNLGDAFDFTGVLRIVKETPLENGDTHYILCTKPDSKKCAHCVSRLLCESPVKPS